MLSSVNAFGGLSSAELLMLFGANSASSSSDSKATNAVQSTPPGVSGSSANDPANTIKAILAQAEIAHAQTAASLGASAVSTTAEAVYAAQISEGAAVTAPGVIQAQTGNASSPLGVGATLSSLDAISETFNAGIGIDDVSSLAVITSNGTVSLTTGHANGWTYDSIPVVTAYRANEALEAYQYQNEEYQSQLMQAPGSETDVPSASVSNETSSSVGNPQAAQSDLRVTISVYDPTVDPQFLYTQVQAQAQQLVSAFESHSLESTAASGTGFSYAENFGAATSVIITGAVVASSDILTKNSPFQAPVYNSLAYESTAYKSGWYAGSGFTGDHLTFMMPLEGS